MAFDQRKASTPHHASGFVNFHQLEESQVLTNLQLEPLHVLRVLRFSIHARLHFLRSHAKLRHAEDFDPRSYRNFLLEHSRSDSILLDNRQQVGIFQEEKQQIGNVDDLLKLVGFSRFGYSQISFVSSVISIHHSFWCYRAFKHFALLVAVNLHVHVEGSHHHVSEILHGLHSHHSGVHFLVLCNLEAHQAHSREESFCHQWNFKLNVRWSRVQEFWASVSWIFMLPRISIEIFFKFSFTSFIKTILMFAGDFSVDPYKLDSFWKQIIFLCFVLTGFILYNLINGLAISDIQKLKDDAEFLNLKQRIRTTVDCEKLSCSLYWKLW